MKRYAWLFGVLYAFALGAFPQHIAAESEVKPRMLRVVQLGDSHTAGEYFTDEVRRELQQLFGHGGMGWLSPISVRAQRISQLNYAQEGWQARTSQLESGAFPLGGVLAESMDTGGTLHLSARQAPKDAQHSSIMIKPIYAQSPLIMQQNGQVFEISPQQEGEWQVFDFSANFPISFTSQAGDLWQIGSIYTENRTAVGAVVSALGINGAQWAHWERWRADWAEDLARTKADVVILAYGTNEAFYPLFDVNEARVIWREHLRTIRKTLPRAKIVLIGAPEALSSTEGECGVRAMHLDAVQALQAQFAREERLFFWSWQQAMGGECSMNAWILGGLAARDGVHFSQMGYELSARLFVRELLAYLNESPRPSHHTKN